LTKAKAVLFIRLFLWRLNLPQNSCIRHSQIDDQHHRQKLQRTTGARAWKHD